MVPHMIASMAKGKLSAAQIQEKAQRVLRESADASGLMTRLRELAKTLA
jgi:hypothetical protein